MKRKALLMITLVLSLLLSGCGDSRKDSKKATMTTTDTNSAFEVLYNDKSKESNNSYQEKGSIPTTIESEEEFQNNISMILGTWETECGDTMSISDGEWDDNKVNDEHYRLDGGAASVVLGYIDNIYALRNIIDFGSGFDFSRYSQIKIHYSSSLDYYLHDYNTDVTDNYLLAIKIQWRMYPCIYVESVSDTTMVLENENGTKMTLNRIDSTNSNKDELNKFEQELLDRAIEEIKTLQMGDIDKYVELLNMDMIYNAHQNEMFLDGEFYEKDELTDRVKESAYETAYDLEQVDVTAEPYDFELGDVIGNFSVKERDFSFRLGEYRIECTYYFMEDNSMDSVDIDWVY